MTEPDDDAVEDAAELAREVAPGLSAVLLTHYPDADTLDIFRPGETELATAQAVNRVVAERMAEAGVEVFVQRADRAAFRRWMAERADTPANRHAWVDRANLLRGAAALALLGVRADAIPVAAKFGKAPGPLADRLLDAYGEEDDEAEFDAATQALLAAGRMDVLDLAVRKQGERQGEEAADELSWVFLVAAEGAAMGPSGWAELVSLPVALPAGALPESEALVLSLMEAGAIPPTDEIRLLPGWRSPEAMADLSFAGVRRVLTDMVGGKAPRDLPPGDSDDLAERGFGALIGLRIDWGIPAWEAIAAGQQPPDEDGELTPEEKQRQEAFERWRSGMFQNGSGCVPLGLIAFSDTASEIAAFLAEAEEQSESFEQIRDFITMAYKEAGEEAVVCRSAIVKGGLKLSLFTESGRFLDDLALSADELPAPAEEVQQMVEGFVQMARGGLNH